MSRWKAKLFAWCNGYFWLPCPVCGREFGGHERPNGELLFTETSSTMTCSECVGYWVERDGRCVQVVPRLDEAGEVQIGFVYGSSEWRKRVAVRGSI